MNGGILALMLGGLIGFGAGAYLAATGERPLGIALMAMGLVFQVLTLRQLKLAKRRNAGDGQ
jgi:Zn-dependent membrane protease YugP